MFTPISKCAIVLLLSLILFACTNDRSEAGMAVIRDTLNLTADNLRLNLCGSVVEANEARTVYDEVAATFYYDNAQTPVDPLEVTIDSVHLEELKDVATNAHPNHNCDGYVTGLKISFGMENNQSRLLYQAVYFCRSGQTTSFTAYPAGEIQVYGTSGFGDASANQKNWMDNYYDHLKVMQDGQLRNFDSEGDSTDVRAVYITFQALSAVMRHNQEGSFTIWDYKAEKPDGSIRHTMIVGPGNVMPFDRNLPKSVLDKLWLFSNFQNNFADRSNLCPPSCDIASFTVAVASQADCQ